jgi:hypothetical protein
MIFSFSFEFGIGFGFGFDFSPVDIQWISEINHLKLKLMFYNMLIITYLLRLLNLFKIDSWKYLLFIASYLYMWICVYLSAGFGYPFGFRVSAGLILVMNFHPNQFSVRVQIWISGFDFGCTETPLDSNPTRCHPYPGVPLIHPPGLPRFSLHILLKYSILFISNCNTFYFFR